MSAVKTASSSGGDSGYTLAHLSDPHLFTLEAGEMAHLFNKRLLGLLSWKHRRGAEHRIEVLEALQRDLQSLRPDQVAVTGDLTHIGLPGEYRRARGWLETLGTPDRVTVVPGNHDALVPGAWEHSREEWRPFFAADRGEEPLSTGPAESFPAVRIRGPLALIGLSSACPTLPLLAVGKLGCRQLADLVPALQRTRAAGLVRILLIHHPPLPGMENPRRRLTDARALAALLARHGAELILHGHCHASTENRLETASGGIPVIGVPSVSEWGARPDRRARYHLFHFQRTAKGWQMTFAIRSYRPAQERFAPEGEKLFFLPPGIMIPNAASTGQARG